jgi:hypothetical protein
MLFYQSLLAVAEQIIMVDIRPLLRFSSLALANTVLHATLDYLTILCPIFPLLHARYSPF